MNNEVLDFIKEFGSIFLYGITFLFSIINYQKYFDSILRYFPMIIVYTLFTEILGGYIRKSENFQIIFVEEHSINNSLIFNIFDIVFFLYFFFIYWKSLKSAKQKKMVKYGAFLFVATSFVNPFFQDFLLYPQKFSIIIGSINIILSTILFLKQVKKHETGIPNKNNIFFWVSWGLLIFYIAYPFMIIIGLYYLDVYIKFNIRYIHQFLICLMYSCFIIGFIKMSRIKPLEIDEI